MKDSKDLKLIEAILNERNKGFNQLYYNYENAIISFLRYKGAKKDLKIIFHDTLLAFEKMIKKENFVLKYSIMALLKIIAWRVFLKWLRKYKPLYELTEKIVQDLSNEIANLDLRNKIIAEEQMKHIENEIAKLDPYMLQVFNFKNSLERSYTFLEIAGILHPDLDKEDINKKANAIRQKYHQTLKKFTKKLVDY